MPVLDCPEAVDDVLSELYGDDFTPIEHRDQVFNRFRQLRHTHEAMSVPLDADPCTPPPDSLCVVDAPPACTADIGVAGDLSCGCGFT